MELLLLIKALCISFLVLLTPSFSLEFQMQLRQHKQGNDVQHSFYHILPRKLRFTEEVKAKNCESQDSLSPSQQKQREVIAGKSYKKVQATMKRVSKGGTWQEWIEGPESSHEFFTMDYSHVRRRRPIHNK